MEELSAPTFAPRMGADTDVVGVTAIKGWKLQLCLDDAGQLVQLDASFQTSLRINKLEKSVKHNPATRRRVSRAVQLWVGSWDPVDIT